ncbi:MULTISPECIES: NAD(P)-dependent oxidoreductase [unclassified Arthrobacter]|uniref:NAD(P)-dependent oxidoreductase n=1 Tax=unclassified Arthrobacter TaxID=235627 RepID=UPI0036733B92
MEANNMQNVLVFGATGYAGAHISRELTHRGFPVTGVARRIPQANPDQMLPPMVEGSIFDEALVKQNVREADIIVVAVPSTADGAGGELHTAMPGLLSAAAETGCSRLAVVGGAGSLRMPQGDHTLAEDSSFPDAAKPSAAGQKKVLDALESAPTDLDWFYLSPPAQFGARFPGERTGRYRVGKDTLLVSDGKSTISGADYALAFVDEIDLPIHHQRRFTVGY